MQKAGLIETGVQRIGAEQELFFVDRSMRPAPLCGPVLGMLKDPRFVTELAQFNLEANVTPLEFKGRCLRVMEAELEEMIGLVRRTTQSFDAEIVLAGILPTFQGGTGRQAGSAFKAFTLAGAVTAAGSGTPASCSKGRVATWPWSERT